MHWMSLKLTLPRVLKKEEVLVEIKLTGLITKIINCKSSIYIYIYIYIYISRDLIAGVHEVLSCWAPSLHLAIKMGWPNYRIKTQPLYYSSLYSIKKMKRRSFQPPFRNLK